MQSPPEIELKVPLIHILARLESSHRSFLVTFISSANPAQLSKHKPLDRKKATLVSRRPKCWMPRSHRHFPRNSCPADVRAHQAQSVLQELLRSSRNTRERQVLLLPLPPLWRSTWADRQRVGCGGLHLFAIVFKVPGAFLGAPFMRL